MLHGFGMSVEYNRVMRVEAQIEATVLERMEQNGECTFHLILSRADMYSLQLITLILLRTRMMGSVLYMGLLWQFTRRRTHEMISRN